MRIAAASLVLALAACSFALPEPHAPASPDETCDPDSAVPKLDAAMSVALLVLATVVIVEDQQQPDMSDTKGFATELIGLPAFVAGVVYGVAALDGHGKNDRCTAARRGLSGSAS